MYYAHLYDATWLHNRTIWRVNKLSFEICIVQTSFDIYLFFTVELVRRLPLFRLGICHLVYCGFFISFMKKYTVECRPSFLFIYEIAVTHRLTRKLRTGPTFIASTTVQFFQFLFLVDSNFYVTRISYVNQKLPIRVLFTLYLKQNLNTSFRT